MQRDDWYEHCALAEGDSSRRLRSAARPRERALSRARRAQDRDARVSGAVRAGNGAFAGRPLARRGFSGGALYRRASFLVDHAGKQLFPDWMLDRRAPAPAARPGLGRVRCRRRGDARFGAGRRRRAAALHPRQLFGAQARPADRPAMPAACTTSSSQPMPDDFDAMLKRMGRGLLVTELMGQGVNADHRRLFARRRRVLGRERRDRVSGRGDHDRGNLATMFERIEAVGSDVDLRSHILTGSMLVGRMTVAGRVALTSTVVIPRVRRVRHVRSRSSAALGMTVAVR